MKKIIFGLVFCLLAYFGQAQNGLEGIIVEKYYIANAADAAGSVGVLPEGSVTYRIWVDMLPGYNLRSIYGDANNALKLTTTSTFFNNEDRGATTPTMTANQAKGNTVMLDSWLSVGAAHAGKLGVMKSDDDNVAVTNPPYVNANGILANNDPAKMGIPLTTQDGFYSGGTIPQSITFVGIDPAVDLTMFDATSQAGSSFTTSNGAWSALSGAVGADFSLGATAKNKVLIAQITTDGQFHYELNIQLQDPNGDAEKYVVANPQGTERTISSLVGTLGGSNTPPTVSIVAPTTNPTNILLTETVNIDVDASDVVPGSVSSVVLKILKNGIAIPDVTLTGPNYTYAFQPTAAGIYSFTAVATDNDGDETTSTPALVVNVTTDPVPTMSEFTVVPADGAAPVEVGDVLNLSVTATDNNGVTGVQFFEGTNLLPGTVLPVGGGVYTLSYTPTQARPYSITAKATDTDGGVATTAPVVVTVLANALPTVTITEPDDNDIVNVSSVVTLTADVADTQGGSVVSGSFKVGTTVITGTIAAGVLSATWTAPATEPLINTLSVEATVTDNKGATKTSTPVTITVVDPAAAKPYEFGNITQSCTEHAVWMPVYSTRTAMDSVIGYDMALRFKGADVTPTGLIVVSSELGGDSTKTSYLTNIEGDSIMNITIFFSDGYAAHKFAGAGLLFSAEFNRKPAFLSNDTTLFAMKSFVESYKTTTLDRGVKPGLYISYKDSIFNGSLKFWKDFSPIKWDKDNVNDYLITNIYGSANPLPEDAVQPDLDGNFKYIVTNGTSIAIKRDINNFTDVHTVIMGADALAAAYIANKNASFTPTVFNMIAADVNRDGKVSAGDATQINYHAVNVGEFTQAGTLAGSPAIDWSFVSSSMLAEGAYKISATYPEDDTNPVVTERRFSRNRVPVVPTLVALPNNDYANCVKIGSDVYTGIMLGDVNGNYAAIPADGLLKSAEINEELVILDFSKAVVENNVVTVPVSVSTSLTELHAIDLGIYINDEKIEKIEVVQNSNFSSLNLGYNEVTKKLDIAGFSMNAIPTDNSFSLKITKKNSSDLLVAGDFNAVQVNLTNSPWGTIIDGTLKVIDQTTTGISDFYNNNIAVYPNPANDYLNVKVAENSNVRIFDVNGRLLIETTVNADQKVIDVQHLTNGVYMMKVYNSNSEPSMFKVIIQK